MKQLAELNAMTKKLQCDNITVRCVEADFDTELKNCPNLSNSLDGDEQIAHGSLKFSKSFIMVDGEEGSLNITKRRRSLVGS